MNRLKTPIPYENRLGDLRELGSLSLLDQVTTQIIVPIGDSNPDSGDGVATSQLLKCDPMGALLTDRLSVGYSDMTSQILSYTDTPAINPIVWPEGYKALWIRWLSRFETDWVMITTEGGALLMSIYFEVQTRASGIINDFSVRTAGTSLRTGDFEMLFFK